MLTPPSQARTDRPGSADYGCREYTSRSRRDWSLRPRVGTRAVVLCKIPFDMLFPTGMFVVFFVVVFAISWALAKRPRVWQLFMLAASYFFYVGWGWKFALLLAGYTLVNYSLGLALSSAARRRRRLLALAIILDLLPLVVYKYYGFLAFNLSELFGRSGAGVVPASARSS